MDFIKKLLLFKTDPETSFAQAYKAETEYHNYERAIKLYEKAAKRGLAKAQYYCGYMYLKGRGVRKSNAKALELIEKAALQGYPKAQYLLAQMYFSGEGVAKNETLGEKWLDMFNEHQLPEPNLSFHSF